MNVKPKECCNQSCRSVFYVIPGKLHLPLQCTKCIDKRKEQEKE